MCPFLLPPLQHSTPLISIDCRSLIFLPPSAKIRSPSFLLPVGHVRLPSSPPSVLHPAISVPVLEVFFFSHRSSPLQRLHLTIPSVIIVQGVPLLKESSFPPCLFLLAFSHSCEASPPALRVFCAFRLPREDKNVRLNGPLAPFCLHARCLP